MTYPTQPDAASEETRSSVFEHVLGLTCLRTAADQGWLTYGAGEYRGQWVRVSRGRSSWWRYLKRDWVHPWTEGLADQHKAGHLIDALAAQPLPDLVTLAEAGQLLDVRYDRLRGMVADKQLYPVYAAYMRQYLFRAQVELLAREKQGKATVQAARRWQTIADRLPPLVRPRDVTGPIRFRPSPNPLPVPAIGPASARQGRVCAIGHEQGWWTYRGAVVQPRPAVFTVEVADANGGGLVRQLVQSRVLPYGLGASEPHGASALVAFAENQG